MPFDPQGRAPGIYRRRWPADCYAQVTRAEGGGWVWPAENRAPAPGECGRGMQVFDTVPRRREMAEAVFPQ